MGAGPGLVCAYCGDRHARAADVRACWARTGGAQYDGAPAPAPPPLSPAGVAVAEDAPGERRARVGSRPVLGRSVLVAPGGAVPDGWEGCRRASGDLAELEEAWRSREPLVIEVAEPESADEVERRPVWSLSPYFSFAGERRAHATFANAVDARSGELRFPLLDAAVALGATAGGPADVVLADGRPAYVDGGPFTWRDEYDGAAVIARLTVAAGALTPFGANATPAALAPDQYAAVTHAGGAARVIAPAGSGKTRVLTERARHLLGRGGVPGRALTLVAFNRRAAEEMRERTTDLPELQIRTLNALGLALVGGRGSLTTIDEREVRALLDQLVDLPRRANTDPAAAWIEALSAVRLGLQSPEEVEAAFGGDVDGLAEVFDRYRGALAGRRVVDFDEQIYGAIEVLLGDPQRRRAARAACGMLLVDEFQDLTPAHLLLLRLLAGPDGAVFGVGDDDQTIYGYTGASPAWLLEYRRAFPTAGEHALEVNYRCPPAVVRAAHTLLTHNRQRIEKRIVPAPGRPEEATALSLKEGADPLAATLAAVSALLGAARPDEIAVLARVNASLAPVQVALAHRGIGAQNAVDASYLARGGVQAALAWLRLAQPGRRRLDGRDVALALRRPARGAAPRAIAWAAEQSDLAGLVRLAGRLSGRDAEKIAAFVADLRAVTDVAAAGTTADVLRAVRDTVGLDRAMALLEGARRRLDRSAQTDDLDALVALGVLHPDIAGFEEWLRAGLDRPSDPSGVVLATVHRVKGQEWPHVVLHEVSAGLLPHRLAEDEEEERRVFHVGITRAQRSLTLVAGAAPSPFLRELAQPWRPGEPTARPARRPEVQRAARRASEPVLHAAVGCDFDHGGQRLRVRALGEDHVIAAVGAATMRVDFGALVIVAGRQMRLAAPAAGGDAAERTRQALRAWRAERAARERKPPYVYLHDRTLEAIATALPSEAAELAAVPGIGPAKLDAYGDELLALVAGALAEPGGDAPPPAGASV